VEGSQSPLTAPPPTHTLTTRTRATPPPPPALCLQQQEQPGTAGTGCSFLYPLLNSSCPTDPQVTVTNLTLRRVSVYDAVLSPGILLMNASNPGTNWVWDAVVFHNVSSWPVPGGYLCESVQGVARGGTSPVPPCFTTEGEGEGEGAERG
jgi:hypothetical protein